MNRSGQTKIFNKKGEQIGSFTEADVQRDKREEQEWLKQGDLAADTCEAGREAAYEERNDEELCLELIGKFAQESARRTKAANIGEIRDLYEMIVTEFLAARYTQSDEKRYSLSSVLLKDYGTDTALNEFLSGEFAAWIQAYTLRCIRGLPHYHWKLNGSDLRAVEKLRGHALSKDMMTVLGVEYVRDREGLKRFLSAVFENWRKIYDPQNPWLVRLLTQQHLGGPQVVAQYVENTGVVSPKTTGPQVDSLRQRIKQYRSRDRKDALKRQKAR